MNFWKIVPSMSKFESSRRFKRILENFWEKLSKFSEEFFFLQSILLDFAIARHSSSNDILGFSKFVIMQIFILWDPVIRYKIQGDRNECNMEINSEMREHGRTLFCEWKFSFSFFLCAFLKVTFCLTEVFPRFIPRPRYEVSCMNIT